jgi:hypothetical protein
MILWNSPLMQNIYRLIFRLLEVLGFDLSAIIMLKRCFNQALFGSP